MPFSQVRRYPSFMVHAKQALNPDKEASKEACLCPTVFISPPATMTCLDFYPGRADKRCAACNANALRAQKKDAC